MYKLSKPLKANIISYRPDFSKRYWYYLVLLALPLFFILHGANENFGLVSSRILVGLGIYYLLITVAVAWLSEQLIANPRNAFLFSCLTLGVFFFFGAIKDLIKPYDSLRSISSYRVVLPLMLIFLTVALICLRKSRLDLQRFTWLVTAVIAANLLWESARLAYNQLDNGKIKQEFGDLNHSLVEGMKGNDTMEKPVIFYIVFDEYSASSTMKKRWNFTNPLDSVLRQRGFFVADEATSPYNSTQYSLCSTLDMTYLDEFPDFSVIRYRDLVRGQISLAETNTTRLLKKNGYKIVNHSISDMTDNPASPYSGFQLNREMLVNNETLTGRMQLDIGWNLPHLLSPSKRIADSIVNVLVYQRIAARNDSLMNKSLDTIKKLRDSGTPVAFMIHMMYTHDPFLYNADGTLNVYGGLGILEYKYPATIAYGNQVIRNMIDSIQGWYDKKNIAIMLQGDHGFKFNERDPMFVSDRCKIMYAVYCSDGDYSGWDDRINAVNSFRIFFNKYFKASFRMLPGRTHNLLYR